MEEEEEEPGKGRGAGATEQGKCFVGERSAFSLFLPIPRRSHVVSSGKVEACNGSRGAKKSDKSPPPAQAANRQSNGCLRCAYTCVAALVQATLRLSIALCSEILARRSEVGRKKAGSRKSWKRGRERREWVGWCAVRLGLLPLSRFSSISLSLPLDAKQQGVSK